jgi:hypothetical protein
MLLGYVASLSSDLGRRDILAEFGREGMPRLTGDQSVLAALNA